MSENLAHDLDEKPRTKDIFVEESFSFNSLLLSTPILDGLKDAGFYKPSPVQLKAIPLGKCGLDLIVQAKSGTGKTVVFAVVALEMIQTKRNALQVLAFAPTREIAVQIEDVVKTIGKYIPGLRVGSFIGGLPVEDDVVKIKKCHIAIGAPGRIKHLIEKKWLKTNSIRLLVFDEVDKLLDASLQNDMNFIYSKLPEQKQVMTLSATYSEKLLKSLNNYMNFPTFVTPEVESALLLGLKQFVLVVKEHLNVNRQIVIKTEWLTEILLKVPFTQCLIFFNSQSCAEGVSNTLNRDGWKTSYISAAQSQDKRLKVMNSLKKFECKILLTTDLTARGIDAANVDLVINFDVPVDTATYLHRMGRAGRYGSHGVCVTIAGDNKEFDTLQSYLGEIGGTGLSIAKLVKDDLNDQLWKKDYNSFEKMYGTVDNHNNSWNEELKNSVFNMKANCKHDVTTEVVSSSFEKLCVEGNTDQSCQEKQTKTSEHDGCQMNKIENDNIDAEGLATGEDITLITNKIKEEHTNVKSVDRYANTDAETLLENLAAGKGVSSICEESINNENDQSCQEKQTKTSEHDNCQTDKIENDNIDAEDLLKGLAAGEDMTLITNKIKEEHTNVKSVDKYANTDAETLLKNLAAGKGVLSIGEESINNESEDESSDKKIEGMNDWYPWVPVEGYSVFDTNTDRVNLLEGFLQEKKTKKRKVATDHVKEDSQSAEVPLRNLAVLSVCKLSAEDVPEDELKKHATSVTTYLNYIKDKMKTNMSNISKRFENVDCNDLLKNIGSYSQQLVEEDPMENIFEISFHSIARNGKSWVEALGDKYDLEESDEEMETECEEEFYEEESQDEEVGYEYDDMEENTQAAPQSVVPGHTLPYVPIQQNYYPMQLAHCHSGYFDDVNGDIYDWYFNYHGQKFVENANKFKNVTSFDGFSNEWRSQVYQCRDYVRQHIYLQEMNYHLIQRGNGCYSNTALTGAQYYPSSNPQSYNQFCSTSHPQNYQSWTTYQNYSAE